MTDSTTEQPAEQLRYAAVLNWGTHFGLATLVLSFAAYVIGLLPPHVALDRLPALWNLPVGQYLRQTQSPTGWGWLTLIGRGDIAALTGIVILAGCSLVCLLALVPLYMKRGDRTFALLCVAEVAIVVLAASGVLAAGH